MKIDIGWIPAIALLAVLLVLVTMAYVGGPVIAASDDPPCVSFAKIGVLEISRCEDETNGKVLYVNNYGFMTYAGD